MAGKRITIHDIARLAGVSKATVSRVLNHKPDVDPSTRERVMRIMEEQGFVPNPTASGLAGGRTHLIGVLVPSFTWPFIGDILRGVSEGLRYTSYELILYSINDSMRNQDKGDIIDHILVSKQTAGLLAILPMEVASHVTRLHKYGFPVVLVDDQKLPTQIPSVGADNVLGGYQATQHLLRLGHRRIAHIHGPTQNLCAQERYQGYCRAFTEMGLTPDPDLVVQGNFSTQSGYNGADKLFSLPHNQRPTAIFTANDQTAYGVIAAAETHGLRIPKDVALVGFDDIASSIHVRPALTTVRQPFDQMGQCAIERLISMIEAPHQIPSPMTYRSSNTIGTGTYASSGRKTPNDTDSADTPLHIQIATTLVVRASCGASTNYADFSAPAVEMSTEHRST